jgi:hypothetical protein
MRGMRRFASAFWLALALLLGQHASLVHALGHATEQISKKKDSKPAPASCDQCFAFAELSNAIGTAPVAFAGLELAFAAHAVSFPFDAPAHPRLAYRSQAPPTFL